MKIADPNTYIKSYDAPQFNKKEMLRYAGVAGNTEEFDRIIDSCIAEIKDKLCYRVCYREFSINVVGDMLDLGFAKTESRSLTKNLSGCESIILFAATVGVGCDRLIAKYSALSPTKALLFDAIGSERIESLCDVFNADIRVQKGKDGYFTRPRFSAGYGDLDISIQRRIFDALDCSRKIGLTLNSSLLMSPTKSVSTIIGIGKE